MNPLKVGVPSTLLLYFTREGREPLSFQGHATHRSLLTEPAMIPERRVQTFGLVFVGSVDEIRRADYTNSSIDRRVEALRYKRHMPVEPARLFRKDGVPAAGLDASPDLIDPGPVGDFSADLRFADDPTPSVWSWCGFRHHAASTGMRAYRGYVTKQRSRWNPSAAVNNSSPSDSNPALWAIS